MAELLLRYGADITLETSRGRTALVEACRSQNEDLIHMLLNQRANLSHINRLGVPTIRIAKEYLDPDIYQGLLDVQDINSAQKQLYCAIARSDYDLVSKLVSGGDKAYR